MISCVYEVIGGAGAYLDKLQVVGRGKEGRKEGGREGTKVNLHC